MYMHIHMRMHMHVHLHVHVHRSIADASHQLRPMDIITAVNGTAIASDTQALAYIYVCAHTHIYMRSPPTRRRSSSLASRKARFISGCGATTRWEKSGLHHTSSQSK